MKRIARMIMVFTCSSLGMASDLRFAVLDFRADGVNPALARKVTELIRSEMINVKGFTVIERSRISDVLKEQGFQQTGSTELEYAVKMGKLLSAHKILVGSVMQLQDKIVITGRIVDVERGVGEFSHTEAIPEKSDLFAGVSYYTENLINRIQGKPVVKREVPIAVATPLEKKGYAEKPLKMDPSVNGKYYELIQRVHCPADAGTYGSFSEWGYWSGTQWCGQSVQPGYWIWVAPHWYI